MSIFSQPRGDLPDSPNPAGPIPVAIFDLAKRYDIYCTIPGEDRLYENVKIIGIRAFEPKKHEYANALMGGYLELEAVNGARMMVPHLRLYMICEHGTQPAYKVLRTRTAENGV